jgi:transcription elongation factor/antiterminator RfaH
VGTQAWYVLHSKPHKERYLSNYLQSQGIETYYPTLRVNPVNPRARKIRPYFPRYLFVYVDLETIGLSTLRWAPGAFRLVMFGGQPATVPEHIIAQLKQHLARVEYEEQHYLDDLQAGDPVRIVDGPLAGYEAIFDLRLSGTERVQVLLATLNRAVKVQVDGSAIRKKRA